MLNVRVPARDDLEWTVTVTRTLGYAQSMRVIVLSKIRFVFVYLEAILCMDSQQSDSHQLSRRRAAIAVSPFLALGVADIVLLLIWGIDPLWGFMILPPILFITTIGWFAFRTGFARDRT